MKFDITVPSNFLSILFAAQFCSFSDASFKRDSFAAHYILSQSGKPTMNDFCGSFQTRISS